MVKEFGDSGGDTYGDGGFDTKTEKEEGDRAAEQAVYRDLDRVLIEGHHDFHPPWGMVDLVTELPEERGFVAQAVPPVIDKRGDDVSDGDLPPDVQSR